MKKRPFTISPGFAQLELQIQNDLLRDLIQKQDEVIKRQEKQLDELGYIVKKQAIEIEQLKTEVRRLKDLKTKPKIRPSKMNKDDDKSDKDSGGNTGGKRAGSEKRSKQGRIFIHQREVIKATGLPNGSKFKGYQKYLVQGLEINVKNVLYKLERWRLPNGDYKVASLPDGIKGHHFSPELRAYILHQHHHQGVTQPLLLSQLREWGIDISTGQLNWILTENKEEFHLEKKKLLTTGLSISPYIQTDDTGARHDGKNGYCTHIGNELFAWFESTSSKSRINFLTLLCQDHADYIINEHALAYMKRYRLAPKYRKSLNEGNRNFSTKVDWFEHMNGLGINSKRTQRIATEGALIGALIHHGFRMDLVILSDDAGQFNLFQHALCWIHAERKINELIGSNEIQTQAIQNTRNTFWSIYDELKAYKKAPSIEAKNQIEKKFDDFVGKKTEYATLNLVLKRMRLNKKELLLVLERPEIPLHNNLSERDIREYVKKRKISGSTRSDEGRRCRDTFTSLKKTCRKLGVRFWDYLVDRLSKKNVIPALNVLMAEKAAAY